MVLGAVLLAESLGSGRTFENQAELRSFNDLENSDEMITNCSSRVRNSYRRLTAFQGAKGGAIRIAE